LSLTRHKESLSVAKSLKSQLRHVLYHFQHARKCFLNRVHHKSVVFVIARSRLKGSWHGCGGTSASTAANHQRHSNPSSTLIRRVPIGRHLTVNLHGCVNAPSSNTLSMRSSTRPRRREPRTCPLSRELLPSVDTTQEPRKSTRRSKYRYSLPVH
jgi:hypothetical protein